MVTELRSPRKTLVDECIKFLDNYIKENFSAEESETNFTTTSEDNESSFANTDGNI